MDDRKMPPMTNFERDILLELVKTHKDVVENKKTDTVCMKKKNAAWEEISKEFCGVGNTNKRSGKQLKKCWNNKKFKSRQHKTAERKERILTGGGPPPDDQTKDSTLLAVESIVPHLNMRVSSEFDSDCYIGEDIMQTVPVSAEFVEGEELDLPQIELPTTSENVDTQRSRKKQNIKKQRETATGYLEERKKLEMEQLKELHQLKILHENEYHAARLLHQQEIHNLTIQHMKELHQQLMNAN